MILAWKGREVNDQALRLRHEGPPLVVQWLRLCAPKAGAWGLVPDLPSQVALVIKNPLTNAGDIRNGGFDPWVGKIPWRKVWQSTAVFLPGEAHRQRGLAGYSPWGHTELDATQVTARMHAYFLSSPQLGTAVQVKADLVAVCVSVCT